MWLTTPCPSTSVRGIPDGTPSWVKLYDVVSTNGNDPLYVDSLVVSNAVQDTWAAGAEILITSHTRDWDGHQKRTIVGISDHNRDGYVELNLDRPAIRPITMRNDRDFAVEVALLSRNILFDAMLSSWADHGGHFWVFHTPRIHQMIEGVEIRNFGQQGTLGRYPLHFHVCGDVSGSVVAKNTIRSSHQRCIVVHATNNLQLHANVAFDTKGHCFMLEDGIETGNIFTENLGAMTAVPEVIIPASTANGRETDFMPSTFWITNPSNEWVGNIAAGSEGSGFWIEPITRGLYLDLYPDVNPKTDPLLVFRGNEAHSNANKGLRSYPSGYTPSTMQTIAGFKAYRNDGTGVFLHNSRNIRILRGRIADNKHIGIDIDKAGSIVIEDVAVVGLSSAFQSILDTQDVSSPCRSGRLYGIELHTWQAERLEGKILLSGVKFQGFNLDFCVDSVPVHFEGDTRTGQFDAFTSIQGITLDNTSETFDMCSAQGNDVDDIYVTDLDGGLRPGNAKTKHVTSTIFGHTSLTLDLLNTSNCQEDSLRCWTYCPNICVRTVQLQIDPAGTERYTVKACKVSDSSACISASGFRWADSFDALSYDPRVFTLQLPAGNAFTVKVLNGSGAEVFPRFVRVMEIDSPCGPSVGKVSLVVPKLDASTCQQLVRNGSLQRGDGLFWLHRFGGLAVEGSQANTVLTTIETSPLTTVVQYLDVRCFRDNVDEYFEIEAEIKLEQLDGRAWFCDSDQNKCPVVGIFDESGGFQTVASVSPVTISSDGVQKASGFVKIDKSLAEADEVQIFVRSNVQRRRMVVKSVSMRLVANPDVYCLNLIAWPTREPHHVWSILGNGVLSSTIIESAPGIRFSARKDYSDAMVYEGWRDINLRCATPGSKWRLVTKLRLEKLGKPVACALNSCPEVRFALRDASSVRVYVEKSLPECWDFNEWKTCKLALTLPPNWDGTIQRVVLEIAEFAAEYDLALIDMQMRPVT